MNKPLVTVFIPLYNCETYIRESLESIINQSYSNLEILIIDDGSTDKSVDIVSSYMDIRIRLIKNGENKGIPYTRNLGLQESNGKYMAIMDADDIAYPNRIEKQVEFMEENSDIDAVASDYEVFDERSIKTNKSKYNTSEGIKAGLIFSNRIGNPTALVRLETIKRYNIGYNMDYYVASDYDMFVQISKVGKLFILPEVLLKYRFGHSNITKNTLMNKALQRKKIIDLIHKDTLVYYDFKFNEVEIDIFNEFFNDNFQSKLSKNTINNLPEILNIIIKKNRSYKLFNEELFLGIISDTVFDIINGRALSLISKLYLYNKVCRLKPRSTTKEISLMVIKHLYKFLHKFFQTKKRI